MPTHCTILIDQGPWRVACAADGGVTVQHAVTAPDAGPADKARAAAALVRGLGSDGRVLVALPSSACLSAAITTDGLSRSNRRQAMAYLLEEQLPVSAEDSVADYVEQQGLAMGVCAELDALRAIVEALEAEELSVRHLCPSAMLAGMHLAAHHPDADCLLIRQRPVAGGAGIEDQPMSLDLIELGHKKPQHWWWLTEQDGLVGRLKAWRKRLSGAEPTLVTLGQPIEGKDMQSVAAEVEDADHAVALQAALVLEGEASPWIDLRRDALAAPGAHLAYQKQAGLLVAALVLLLVCVSGATFWRGARYQDRADGYAAEQAEVFKQVFPDQRVPSAGSIGRRLRLEQDKLTGISGQASADDAEALYPTSALTHLYAVLSALPRGPRYQVSDLTIEPGVIRVNGQAASHVIAGQLKDAIEATGRYDADPPNTRAMPGFGVTFGFTARPKPPEEATP